jgi:hypothetical protein
MGRRERQISGWVLTLNERLRRNGALNRALHHALFAHLPRPVADPDQPRRWITFEDRDLRLRGRAYRQAMLACLQAPHGGLCQARPADAACETGAMLS